MKVGALVLSLAIAACGRIGFDGATRGDAGASEGAVDGAASTLPPGAKIWLQMETDPSTGIVDSAGGHACSCSAATGCPVRVAGVHGSGYRFTAHEIAIADAADLDPSSGFTAAAWVRADAYPTTNLAVVFAKPSATGDMFVLAIDTGGHSTFDSEDAGGATVSIGGPMLPVGAWHHVAFVYDGAQKRFYADGALAGMASGSISTNGDPFFVGADYPSPTGFVEATLDDVVYYTRALSPAEVAELATP